MRSAIAVAAILALVACSAKADDPADDPFKADMKMICNAGQGRSDLPPDMRRLEALREITAKVKTPEAARLVANLGAVLPAVRMEYMKDALNRAKLGHCAMLAWW